MSSLESAVIVYAEDNVETREGIARFIRRRVKEVHEANNGQEGLELTRQYHPDAVLTDLEMPVMNGMEMIKKIREEFGPDTPIIVITGYSDEEHYTDEANAFLYKPIQLDEILETMEKLLSKS